MKFSERLMGDMRWDRVQAALAHEAGEDIDPDEPPPEPEPAPPRGLSAKRQAP